MKPTITFNDGPFYAALERAISKSKKTSREVALQSFKGVVRNLFRITPPMKVEWDTNTNTPANDGAFKAGQDAGRKAIDNDLKKAFTVVSQVQKGKKNAVDPRANLAWYLSIRNKRRRVGRKYGVPIDQSDFNSIQKAVYGLQGWTAAGWMHAASRLGISVPKWIGGKSGKGKMQFDERPTSWGFVAVNGTNHSDSQNIQRQVNTALEMQRRKMERSAKFMAEKNLKEAGVGK
jgi:hypothetical protein